MFAFAALGGPVGIAVAVASTVGVVAYKVFSGDEEKDTIDNTSETKNESKEERLVRIFKDIEKYKNKQKTRLKVKYDIDMIYSNDNSKESQDIIKNIISKNIPDFINISYISEMVSEMISSKTIENKITITKKNNTNNISVLEKEIEDMKKIIGEIGVLQHETNK